MLNRINSKICILTVFILITITANASFLARSKVIVKVLKIQSRSTMSSVEAIAADVKIISVSKERVPRYYPRYFKRFIGKRINITIFKKRSTNNKIKVGCLLKGLITCFHPMGQRKPTINLEKIKILR